MKRPISADRFSKRLLILLVAISLAACSPRSEQDSSPIPERTRVEKLLISNHVVTMAGDARHSEAMAVAINGERISWVGSHGEAEASLVADETINLGDQALLPGFIDAHGHATGMATFTQLANVASPPVGATQNIEDLKEALKRFIAERQIPDGDWVIGRGYDDSLLEEQRHPNRDELDAVSTTHPIYLIHVSGHLAAVNSRALARAGINAESEDPPGGHIRRRPGSTEPNGVLEETAASQFRQYLSSAIKDPVGAVGSAMAEYAAAGITTVQDGAASPDLIATLKSADKAGLVNLDVVVYPFGQADEYQVADSYQFGEYDGRIKVAGIKLMLDGSPQGKTAYLTKPYHVPPHGQSDDYRGYPNIPQDRVDQLVSHYVTRGIPIIAHANGDAAADMLIQAVHEAPDAAGADHRTVMIHAQTVREDQLTQMKTLGMVPSFFSAHTFYWGDWHRDSVLGDTRGSRISPTASTLARGMPFTVHNDAPVVPPDMRRLLWATTNRITRSGQVLGSDQRISTYNALRAVTLHAAYQHFEEADKGSIEEGKLADLVVLSTNPLTLPTTDLLDLNINRTYSRGAEVFNRTAASGL